MSAEIKLPNLVVADGQLRIQIGKKGGFSFDGSSVVIELDVTDTESVGAQDPPPNGNGKRKPKDEEQPKINDLKPTAATATNPGKGAS